jgi:hypothetical protein
VRQRDLLEVLESSKRKKVVEEGERDSRMKRKRKEKGAAPNFAVRVRSGRRGGRRWSGSGYEGSIELRLDFDTGAKKRLQALC